jgi:uncharacterized protein YggL (DUF469 family)
MYLWRLGGLGLSALAPLLCAPTFRWVCSEQRMNWVAWFIQNQVVATLYISKLFDRLYQSNPHAIGLVKLVC